MKPRSTTPETVWQDQRPLVLLVIGLIICLCQFSQWLAAPGASATRTSAAQAGDRYLWLTGGVLGKGLSHLPATVSMHRLYVLAGFTPPPGGLAAETVPDCAMLTLRDRAQPLSGPMVNAMRPLFFQAIDVNLADRDLLTTVPGIGPTLAHRIVRRRAERGGFARLEDLLEVRGIGPVRLKRFKPFLQLDN